jgi:hypothetical protein
MLLKIPPDRWAYLIITLLGSIWVCDSAAYFIGKAIGKHKLFERISPKKTIEGAIAGFVFAILSFIGLGKLFLPEIHGSAYLLLGVLLRGLGQYGDLAELCLNATPESRIAQTFCPVTVVRSIGSTVFCLFLRLTLFTCVLLYFLIWEYE